MSKSADEDTKSSKRTKSRKGASKIQANHLRKGIISFCEKRNVRIHHENQASDELGTPLLLQDLPKRFTSYPPLLLLPFNFPTHTAPWTRFYTSLDDTDKAELWRSIVEDGFSGRRITHVAINAPIAAEDLTHSNGSVIEETESSIRKENVMRSPSGLVPVYGDWGRESDRRVQDCSSNAAGFQQAFWISTSQHKGITQYWAPLHTMFSRGNISEKARIMGIDTGSQQIQSPFHGLAEPELGEDVKHIDVVDFYVGIGYFAFSYLHRGVRRIFGWDINPWSIEGLRRGCAANGWACIVVEIDDEGNLSGMTIRELVHKITEHDGEDYRRQVRCVAFLGDNKWAPKVLIEIDQALADEHHGSEALRLNVRHANLGLLPSSKDSWKHAIDVLVRSKRSGTTAWLHVHENSDVSQIEEKKQGIVNAIEGFRHADGDIDVSCIHIEHVKTYAPGVMHCVFDIQLKPRG